MLNDETVFYLLVFLIRKYKTFCNIFIYAGRWQFQEPWVCEQDELSVCSYFRKTSAQGVQETVVATDLACHVYDIVVSDAV